MRCPKCEKEWNEVNCFTSATYICPFCGESFVFEGKEKEDVGQILKKIMRDFGKDVLFDVGKTNALLMDYAPHFEKERKLIIMVMKEGILSQLLKLVDKSEEEKRYGINKCINQLISDVWITEIAARYAVSLLANVIGCLSETDFDLVKEMKLQKKDAPKTQGQIHFQRLLKGDEYNEEEIENVLKKCDCIGFKALAARTNIENMYLPSSIKTIYPKAFLNCINLHAIILPKGLKEIGTCAFEGCASLEKIKVEDGGVFKVLNGVLINTQEKKVVRAENSTKKTDIVIINGITIIAKKAFDRNPVRSISIPLTVEKIEENAFFLTMELEKFIVDDKSQFFKSIEGVLHDRTGKKIIRCPQGIRGISYYLEDTVEEIGYQAFSCTKNLQAITFTSSLRKIGDRAFEFCNKLESLMFPESVEIIGERAFQYCRKLKSVMLSRSILTIGDCAFYNCSSLETICVPQNVEKIGNLAFANCEKLKSVIIQEKISFIGDGAFDGCSEVELSIKNNEYAEIYCKTRGIVYKKM